MANVRKNKAKFIFLIICLLYSTCAYLSVQLFSNILLVSVSVSPSINFASSFHKYWSGLFRSSYEIRIKKRIKNHHLAKRAYRLDITIYNVAYRKVISKENSSEADNWHDRWPIISARSWRASLSFWNICMIPSSDYMYNKTDSLLSFHLETCYTCVQL